MANDKRLSQSASQPPEQQSWPNQMDAGALLRLGHQRLEGGFYPQALALFEQAIAQEPGWVDAWQGKAEALRKMDQLEPANVALEKANELQMALLAPQKMDTESWLTHGHQQLAKGDFMGAITSYDQALKSNSDNHQAWTYLGCALAILGHYEEAIASCDKALEIEPDYYPALNHRGMVLDNLGRYEEAITSFDQALRFKSDDHSVWNNRGKALTILGQHEEAINSFDQALEIKPDYHEAWVNRGNALSSLGCHEKAITNYDQALKCKSDFYEAWHNRGLALGDLSRYKEAIANYNEGLQNVQKNLQPNGWGILHHGLGKIHYRRRCFDTQGRVDIEQALTSYRTACKTLKDFPESYLALIQDLIKAYLWLGNLDQANQWRITGLAVFRDLMNAQSTDRQRRHLEAQFSSISRIDVDVLIQSGQLATALETAERYKNRCLTQIFEQWQENTLSPTYDQIRTLLSPTTALLYWHLSDYALTTFLLTPNAQAPHLLDANHLDQCSRAQRLQTWLTDWNTDYSDYRSDSKEKKVPNPKHSWREQLANRHTQLKELLGLDTLVSCLPKSGITHLILIPHRDLHCLPLAACLPEFVCTTLPSAQVGIALQQHQINYQSDRVQVTLLSVEDPKTHQYQMPYAQLESALLCELFPNHTRLAQTQATADAFVNALNDRRHTLIHFTGHAGYNARHPEDSALILSDNQFLTAQIISHLNFDAYPLVCLSACETALVGTPDINTEYIGLSSTLSGKN